MMIPANITHSIILVPKLLNEITAETYTNETEQTTDESTN